MFTLVVGLVWAQALPSPLQAQAKRLVTIASGAVDGVYYPIAGALSRIASDAKDLNARAVVAPSAGAVANVQLIRAGEADFALLQNDVAYYAFNGVTLEQLAADHRRGGDVSLERLVVGMRARRDDRRAEQHEDKGPSSD